MVFVKEKPPGMPQTPNGLLLLQLTLLTRGSYDNLNGRRNTSLNVRKKR